jgi:hypothetical protein
MSCMRTPEGKADAGPITSYAQLQERLTQILTDNISTQSGSSEQDDAVNNAPHGAFWTTLSYEEFVNGDAPNMGVPILSKGRSAQSNLILALRGQPPFDGSVFSKMPADGPPFLTEEQIAPIAAWIDAGCPE